MEGGEEKVMMKTKKMIYNNDNKKIIEIKVIYKNLNQKNNDSNDNENNENNKLKVKRIIIMIL